MDRSHPGSDGPPGLSALAMGCVLEDLEPGGAVWVAGQGEDELAAALQARGAVVGWLDGEPEAPALAGGPAPALLVAGRGAPSLVAAALARAHAAGCAWIYTRDEAACETARGWYWCHQVPAASRTPTLAETWSGAADAGALAGRNRYGHWVGWRRMLPAGQGSPGPVPAPVPAP